MRKHGAFVLDLIAKLRFVLAADLKQVTLRLGDIKVAYAEGKGHGFSSRKSHAQLR